MTLTELNTRDMRKVYIITSSQANLEKCPNRKDILKQCTHPHSPPPTLTFFFPIHPHAHKIMSSYPHSLITTQNKAPYTPLTPFTQNNAPLTPVYPKYSKYSKYSLTQNNTSLTATRTRYSL